MERGWEAMVEGNEELGMGDLEGVGEFYGLWRGIRDEDEGKEMLSIVAGRVGGKGRR